MNQSITFLTYNSHLYFYRSNLTVYILTMSSFLSLYIQSIPTLDLINHIFNIQSQKCEHFTLLSLARCKHFTLHCTRTGCLNSFIPGYQFCQFFIGHNSPGKLFQQVIQVLVNIQVMCFGHLDHGIDHCAGFCTLWCVAEQPVLRPTVKGRIAFSLRLLEKLHLPSSRQVINSAV